MKEEGKHEKSRKMTAWPTTAGFEDRRMEPWAS